MTGFNEAVLGWLRKEGGHPEATEVVEVYAEGTDWAGGTEEGFYEKFGVRIRYWDGTFRGQRTAELLGLTHGGSTVQVPVERDLDVEGSDLASLWRWVVGAWPAS